LNRIIQRFKKMNIRNVSLAFSFIFLLYGCATTGTLAHRSASHPSKSKSIHPANTDNDTDEAVSSDETDTSDSALYPETTDTYTTDENGDETPDAPADANVRKDIQHKLDKALEFCRKAQKLWEEKEPDGALSALDKAYALILTADSDTCPKLMQQKEDIRFMISKRILEIYASRNVIAKGKHNAIPLVMNRYVQEEIDYLLKGKYFMRAYKRSGRYRPAIVAELKKAGLPTELSWLPLIESGFTPYALSPARALGLWQFIPSTGYKFGLKRDQYVDERMDPEKSTGAAIAYLKELHGMFGDWSSVLAAYNCGEGRVLRVIRQQNINYLDNFWDLYEKLPRETARYVPRFLATLHIVKNLEKYGLADLTADPPVACETLTVSRQVHLNDIAKELDISQNLLRDLNPELRYKVLPGGNYPLKLPNGQAKILLSRLDSLPTSSALSARAESASTCSVASKKESLRKEVKQAYHRVKRGETLDRIAKKYKVDVKKIMRANNMHRHYLVAGKILVIPGVSAKATSYNVASRKSGGRAAVTHIVKKGDSLWNIARKYGITPKDIHRMNKLAGNQLSIGQVLRLPGSKQATMLSSQKSRTYRVKNGDVPQEIARRHNMSLDQFLKINRMSSKSKIYPGQKVYVE